MSVSITALKAQQDSFEKRAQELRSKYIAFSNGFVAELEEFTKQAIDEGLLGVKPVESRLLSHQGTTNATTEVKLTIAGFDLIIILPTEPYLDESGGDGLVSRVFIFRNSGLDNTPVMDIQVHENGVSNLRFFGSRGISLSGGANNADESNGRNVANQFIEFMYTLENRWKPKLTLGQVMRSDGIQKPIGFAFDSPDMD